VVVLPGNFTAAPPSGFSLTQKDPQVSAASADCDANPVAPRILKPKFGSGVVRCHAGNPQAVGERADVVRSRHFDEDFAQPKRVPAGSGAPAVPDVHRHVVVVPAGRNEKRLPVPSGRLLETQGAHVEILRRLDVAHLEVDVPDAGT
jgi:hypothetical protein